VSLAGWVAIVAAVVLCIRRRSVGWSVAVVAARILVALTLGLGIAIAAGAAQEVLSPRRVS
jgi:hypothetical protein